MIRSALALAALLGLAISSGAAYSCEYQQMTKGKQTLASTDNQSKPVVIPTPRKDS